MKLRRETVTMVRIYLTEERSRLERLMDLLKDREQLRGVTVFRGISGYGEGGEVHTSGLLDLSLNLPLVVEFFDEPQKIERVLEDLVDKIDPAHIVSWDAEQMISD